MASVTLWGYVEKRRKDRNQCPVNEGDKTPLELSHGTFGNRFGAWRWREGFDGSRKKDVNC